MSHYVSAKAQSDLDDIWLYVAKQSKRIETANRVIDAIEDAFSLIGLHPFIGRSRGDDFGLGRRSLSAGEYVIVYSIQNMDAFILRVVHGRRDLDFLSEE